MPFSPEQQLSFSPTSPTFPIQLRLLSLPPQPKTYKSLSSRSISPSQKISSLSLGSRSRSASPYSSSLSRSIYTPSSPSPTTSSFQSLISSPASSPTSSVYHSMPPTPVTAGFELDVEENYDTETTKAEGDEMPKRLRTSSELHQAIKSCKLAMVYIYSRASQSEPSLSLTYSSFIKHASYHSRLPVPVKPATPRFALSASLNFTIPNLPKKEVGFFTVCIEDVLRQDIPLMFGRLGVLPSRVAASGSAVSVQKEGRLRKCVVGDARGIYLEDLLAEFKGL